MARRLATPALSPDAQPVLAVCRAGRDSGRRFARHPGHDDDHLADRRWSDAVRQLLGDLGGLYADVEPYRPGASARGPALRHSRALSNGSSLSPVLGAAADA